MFICKYCGKECKNKNSLAQHEIRCKENPNKIQLPESNFIKYNNDIKSGKRHKIYSNQYIKAELLGLPKPIVSDETRMKCGKGGKNQIWDMERRCRHSESMKTAVKEHPMSYSCNFVNGRTPRLEYNGVILNGNWELIVAKYLDINNIKWERPSIPFEYSWENKTHLYYPDFYLPEYDIYLEVKGYERERDKCKWKVVSNLVVLKKKDIEDIKNDNYKFYFIK